MTTATRTMLTAAFAAAAFSLAGCQTQHKVETANVIEIKPIEIKPIYARIDIYIKIDKELDSFFDFEETLKPDAKKPADKG